MLLMQHGNEYQRQPTPTDPRPRRASAVCRLFSSRFVRMFSSLSLFSETLREAMRRMLHIGLIILLIMTGFSVTFHLSFGFQDERYRDFPESIKVSP